MSSAVTVGNGSHGGEGSSRIVLKATRRLRSVMRLASVVAALATFLPATVCASNDEWKLAVMFALFGVVLAIVFARSGTGELRVAANEVVMRTVFSDVTVAFQDVARIGFSHRGNVLLLFSRAGGFAAVALDLPNGGKRDSELPSTAQLRSLLPGFLVSRIDYKPIEWRSSASVGRASDVSRRVLRPSAADVGFVLAASASLAVGAAFFDDGLRFEGVERVAAPLIGAAFLGFHVWLMLRLRDAEVRVEYFKQLDAYTSEWHVDWGVRQWMTRGFYVVNVAMVFLMLAVIFVSLAMVPTASIAWAIVAAICAGVSAVTILASVVVAVTRWPRRWVPEMFRDG